MNLNLDLVKLREAYAKALEGDVPDINRLLELSTDAAREDPDNVRFSTDAGIISRLGRELVAKEETAVAELIKNAYDADATFVKLTFENARDEGGTLIIDDNGLGMTRDQLVAGFMRLSSNEKIVNPFSTRYQRKRAGRKGIGRFAVQRLGKTLTIITQTKDDDKALEIDIDWDVFAEGRELITIANKIRVIAKKGKSEGTTLIIKNLREGWGEKAILRIYRYVSELQQPYPLHTGEQLKKYILPVAPENVDPGFKTELIERIEEKDEVIASEETEIFSHALAEIKGYVDENGNGFLSLESKQLGLDIKGKPIGAELEDKDEDDEEIEDNDERLEGFIEFEYEGFEEDYDKEIRLNEQKRNFIRRMKGAEIKPFPQLRNVSIQVYYFIWDPSLIPRSNYATLRNLGRERGGIKVYRNGFRVLPYGQKDDDWLELDASYSRRIYLPPHGNNTLFGFAEIVDPKGLLFEETSSREGLLENQAFKEFANFCYRAIISSILTIAEARGRKQVTNQRNWVKDIQSPNSIDFIKESVEKLVRLTNEASRRNSQNYFDNTKVDNDSEIANHLADTIKTGVDTLRHELLQELGLLRVLASLGLSIGEFTHEVRQIIGSAYLNARELAKVVFERQEDKEAAEDLFSNIQGFRTYAAYFDTAVSNNTLRELASQDLRLVIGNFIKTIQPSAKRRAIVIEEIIEGYDLLTPPMHASEISSVLFNFYTNSWKAIKRAGRRGKIRISSNSNNKNVYLDFADNGDGIPEHNRDRVFNAFFTTSSPVGQNASHDDELQGTGLGLKIVKDIVESYGGEIYLTSPPEGYSTCFRIKLPMSEERISNQ